jgi:flagellar basal-body rod modification protein FlgD
MSLASVAFQQTSAAAAAAAANAAAAGISSAASGSTASGSAGSTASASTGSSASGTTSALGTLSSNFSSFLNLLTTQLKNQDPSSPMDSNQFTTELVQFSQVEQQINTNTGMTQLIQLTQAGDLTQASGMLGSKVTALSSQLPLQNGSASLNFTAKSAEPVAIAVYNSAGQQILDSAVNATAGTNAWQWNGTDSSGATVPDGAYNVAVIGANSDGTTSALPFTVTGTATGVTSGTNSVSLDLGALSVPFTSVQSVAKAG